MNQVLQSIKKIIGNYLPDARVLLFGSRAKGTSTVNSDYDIFIITQHSLTAKENLSIRSIIHQQIVNTLNVPVDLMMCSESDYAIQQQLHGHIARYVSKESIEL